jgi:hypothetical protein
MLETICEANLPAVAHRRCPTTYQRGEHPLWNLYDGVTIYEGDHAKKENTDEKNTDRVSFLVREYEKVNPISRIYPYSISRQGVVRMKSM